MSAFSPRKPELKSTLCLFTLPSIGSPEYCRIASQGDQAGSAQQRLGTAAQVNCQPAPGKIGPAAFRSRERKPVASLCFVVVVWSRLEDPRGDNGPRKA